MGNNNFTFAERIKNEAWQFDKQCKGIVDELREYEQKYMEFLAHILVEAKLDKAVKYKDGVTGVIRIEPRYNTIAEHDPNYIRSSPYQFVFYRFGKDGEVTAVHTRCYNNVEEILENFEPYEEVDEGNVIYRMNYGASFHGETWYTVSCCGKGVEIYQFEKTDMRDVYICPHCGKKVTTRSYIQGKVIR